MADLVISDQRIEGRTGPLKEEIAEQAKQIREIRSQLVAANAQAQEAQTRAESIEADRNVLANERDGFKSDITRLGSRIASLNDENRRALSSEVGTRKQLEALKTRADKLRFSVTTLVKHVNFSEGFIQQLFFKFFDQLSLEVFSDLGWSTEKIELWSSWSSKAKNTPNDRLIDLLHRQDCPCTGHGQQPTTIRDEDGPRPISDDDRGFVTALLKSRGVDVELEVGKLIATHSHEWRTRNRADLILTPPISHREITPIQRVVAWGED